MAISLFKKHSKIVLAIATALVSLALPIAVSKVSADTPVVVGDGYAMSLNEHPRIGADSGGFIGDWNATADLGNGMHGRYKVMRVSDIGAQHPYMTYTNVGKSPSGRDLDLRITLTDAEGYGDINGNGLIAFGQDNIYVTSFGIKKLYQQWNLYYAGTTTPATDVTGMMYGFAGIDFGQSVSIDKSFLHKDSVFETRNGSNGYNSGRYRNNQNSQVVKAYIDNSGSKPMYAPSGRGDALYYSTQSNDTSQYNSPLLADGYNGNTYTIQGSASNVAYNRSTANLFITLQNGSFSFSFNADGTRAGQGNSSMLENSPAGIHRNVYLSNPLSVTNVFGFKYAGENFFYNRPTFCFQSETKMHSDLRISDTPIRASGKYVADTLMDATGQFIGSRDDGLYLNAPWGVDGNQFIGTTSDKDGQTVHIKRDVRTSDGIDWYMIDYNGQDVYVDARGFSNVQVKSASGNYLFSSPMDATGQFIGSRGDGLYLNAPWGVVGNQFIGATGDKDGQTVHIKRDVQTSNGIDWYVIDYNGQDVYVDARGFSNVQVKSGLANGGAFKQTGDAQANNHWYTTSESDAPNVTSGSEPYDNFVMHQSDAGLKAGTVNVDSIHMYSTNSTTGQIVDETNNFKFYTGADAIGVVMDFTVNFAVPQGQTGEVIATFKSAPSVSDIQGKRYYMQVEHSWKSGGNLNAFTGNWTDVAGNNRSGMVQGSGDYMDNVNADSTWHSTVANNNAFQRARNGWSVYLEQTASTPSISGQLIDSDTPWSSGGTEVTRDMNNVGGAYGYKYTTNAPFVTKDNIITDKVSDFYTGAITQYGINDASPNFRKNGADSPMLNAGSIRVYLGSDSRTLINPSDSVVGQGRTLKWGDPINLYQTGTTATGLTADDKPSLDNALNARNRLIGNSFVMVGNGYGNTGNNISVTNLKVRVPNTLVATTTNYVSNKSLASGGTTSDFQTSIRRTDDDSANNSWYTIADTLMPDASGSHVNTLDLSMGAISNKGNTQITSVKVFKKSVRSNLAPIDVTNQFAIDSSDSTNISISKTNVNAIDLTNQEYFVEIGQAWNTGQNLATANGNWTDTSGSSHTGIKRGTGDYNLASWYRTVLNTGSPATSYNMGYTKNTSKLAYLEQVAQRQSVSGVLTNTDNPQASGTAQVARGMNNINGSYGYKYNLTVPFVGNNDVTTSKVSDYYSGLSYKYGIGDKTPNYQVNGSDTPLLNGGAVSIYSNNGANKMQSTDATGRNNAVGWGGTLVLYQTGTTANVNKSDRNSATSALDARQGVIGNTMVVAGNGYGNNQSNLTVNNLTVKVNKVDSTIHHYKYGTTSGGRFNSPVTVQNPNAVPDTKANGWSGLPVTAPTENLVGWDYATASFNDPNNNPLFGRDDIWFSYKKHAIGSYAKKLSIFTAQKADNSQDVSGSNKATGRWQNTVALTAKNMWQGYKISTDSDLKDAGNNQQITLSGTDGSTYTMPYGQTPVNETVTNNSDGTVNVTAYYTKDDGTYSVSSSNTTPHFAGDSFSANTSANTPWMTYDNTKSGYTYGKANVALNQVIGSNILTNNNDKNGIIRSGSSTAPAVVVTTDDGTTKTYNETYTVTDDASKFSVQSGYGFNNKIDITVTTYNLWNPDKNPTSNDSSYNSNSVDTSATFSPEMLTQSENKQTEQKGVYSQPTITKTVVNNNSNYLTNSVNADAVTYKLSFKTNNSFVRKGAGSFATQTFADKSNDSNYRPVPDNQILVPSTASVFTSLGMSANYGKNLPTNKALFFNNPRFVLSKTIRISTPRYVASNDSSLLQAQTPIAIETPNYGETTGDSAVDTFLSK